MLFAWERCIKVQYYSVRYPIILYKHQISGNGRNSKEVRKKRQQPPSESGHYHNSGKHTVALSRVHYHELRSWHPTATTGTTSWLIKAIEPLKCASFFRGTKSYLEASKQGRQSLLKEHQPCCIYFHHVCFASDEVWNAMTQLLNASGILQDKHLKTSLHPGFLEYYTSLCSSICSSPLQSELHKVFIYLSKQYYIPMG